MTSELAKVEKQQTAGLKRGSIVPSRDNGKGFRDYLHGVGLNKNRANEFERIGAIPPDKLPNAFREKAEEGVLNTTESMFE